MDEIEVDLDDDVAEWIQREAEKEGRTFDEQAGIMIRAALAEVVSTATSGEPTPPPGGSPTA